MSEPIDPLARVRTSELLQQIAAEGEASVSIGDLLEPFGHRAFGLLLIVSILPALIPSPVGAGAIAGPLLAVAGAQILWGLQHPWLPAWLRRRQLKRSSLQRFVQRLGPWLNRIERWCAPRWPRLGNGLGYRFTGLLLVGHGIALSLPVPLTNYPFAFVLLLVAMALLEGDGVLLLVGWLLMAASIGFVASVSGLVITVLEKWMA